MSPESDQSGSVLPVETRSDTLRRMIDSADDIIFIIGENRSIQYTNREIKNLGFSPPGRPADDGVRSDIYKILKDSAEIVFRHGKPVSVERRFGKPGNEVWLHTRLTPFTDELGKVSAVLVIATDISELKIKEKLIAKSRIEWLQAIDTMPYLMAIVGADFRIKKANKALADQIGISLNDLNGRVCHLTLGFEAPPELCPLRRSRRREQGSVDFQSNLFGRPFIVNVTPLTDGSGNTTGCLFIARDRGGNPDIAKARKKNAQELKLLLTRAEHLLILRDNHARYLLMVGLPGNIRLQESILGKTPWDFFEPDTACKILEWLKKAAKTGREFSYSVEVKLAGEIFHLENYILPIRDTMGEIRSLLTISKKLKGAPEQDKSSPHKPLELTKREQEVLKLISAGFTTPQIAGKLFISVKTVETHRSRIMRKVGVHKASALVSYAIKSGLY